MLWSICCCNKKIIINYYYCHNFTVHLIFTEAKVNSFAQRKKTPELTIHTENDYHTIDDDDDDYNDDDDDDDDDGDDDDDDDDNNITFLATTIICSLSALNIRKQG